jgi:glycerophosphoryl diester phosphodiesterase
VLPEKFHMLDRSVFVRPFAHRGLHDAGRGRIENTVPAFEAALARGYGIECDLRPARDGTPMVFHDASLDRLMEGSGPLAAFGPGELKKLRYRSADTRMLTFAELLEMAAGKAPLLAEIKSEWAPPDADFLKPIAALAAAYSGPLALMSFDPAVMAALRGLAPRVPRGIVSGPYQGDGWWRDVVGEERAFRLRHLLESGPAEPSFYAYHVEALPTPVTRFTREVMGIPLFAWTVRTDEHRRRAKDWADASIFEGFEP